MSYALKVGIRYLRSKKRATVSVITVIAVTGVALGVAALLAVMSITSGFQREFQNKVLGVNAHALVLKYGLDFAEYREVIAKASRKKQVAGASPFIINDMMLAKGDRLSGVLVKGVDPEQMQRVLDLPAQLVEGSLVGLRLPSARPASTRIDDRAQTASPEPEFDQALDELVVDRVGAERLAKVPSPEAVEAALAELSLGELPTDVEEARIFEAQQRDAEAKAGPLPGIVVGRTLANNISIRLGDRVKIISPLSGLDTRLWRAGGGSPSSRDFQVVGLFEAGFQEYDARLVYVDLYEAQAFHDQGDTVTGVEIRLHDLSKARELARQLELDMGGAPFHTMDWQELNHNLFTALEIQKIMLSLVIATIIFVAAFNVIATLIMIVLEKRREISILKAMGAKDGAILSIFLAQGTVIGLVGTTAGLALGGGICAYLSAFEFPLDPKVYLIDHLPVRTSAVEFSFTVLVSLGICVTATLIPSWWAAKLLPADGIRYH